MPRKKAAKFTCEKCGKAFGMAMHLGRHMTTIHGRLPTRSVPAAKPKRTASTGAASTLVAIINKLQAQRQEHAAAIVQIDALFEKYGIQLSEPKRRGRKPGRPKAAANAGMLTAGRKGKGRKRGTFEKTAHQSILDFLKGKGKQGATTAEINQQWKSEGRGANADTTLSQLTKQKKLKREKIKGAKGSRYTAA